MSAPVQYDVIPAPQNAGYPYFVILQSDLMQNLATRVVAPLIDASKLDPLGSLWPKVTVGDASYVVVAPLLQSIKLNPATVAVANLGAGAQDIDNAINLVLGTAGQP
jgi:hypothetical protein